MRQLFSTSWRSSVQRRKQHKYAAEAPLHIKHKFLSANLSKDLRKQYGKRNLPLRTGDEVLVMRGSFKKKKAKVTSVNSKQIKIYLEGIQRNKKDGTKVNVPFHPSVLQIISLNSSDKERQASFTRGATPKTQKPVKEAKVKQPSQPKQVTAKQVQPKQKGSKNASN